jgi:predicted MFS family arabinose efflux permease
MLARLMRDELAMLPAVWAVDSIVAFTVFTLGPVITGVVVATTSVAVSLAAAAAACVVSVIAWTTLPSACVRSSSSASESSREAAPSHLGVLRSPGLLVLVACLASSGMVYGSLQVSIIAFADEGGARSTGPWLLALLGVGGVVGALGYGARTQRFGAAGALVILSCTLTLTLLATVLSPSLAIMAPLIVVCAVVFTPTTLIAYQLITDITLPAVMTEAFAWGFVGNFSGNALGLTLAGSLIDAGGWRLGISLSIVAAALGATAAIAGRRVLPNHVVTETVVA